jgi:hypothetical protein
MKTAILSAAALVIFTSIPMIAQQADATAQLSATVNAAGSQVTEAGNGSASAGRGQGGAARVNGSADGSVGGSASAVEEMRPVNAELVGKLDSKSAKVGDQVVLKTTESMKAADGTLIPKGTLLVGNLTSVAAHAKGSADSAMAIQFDHAELKGGPTMAIHSEIRSVAPPASAAMSDSMQSEDSLGGGPVGGGMGGGARAMGGGAMGGGGGRVGGGGAVGGVTNSAVGGVANTTGRAGTGLGAVADDGAGSTSHVAGQAATGVGGGRGNLAAGAAGGVAAHATGVSGVMLAGDASGKLSGTLSAANRNVHLDGGTQMVLGVSAVR